MNKEIFIFDLDGTLLNTLEDLYISTNYALQKVHSDTKTLEEIKNFVGNGVAKLIERAISDGLNNPNYELCLEIFKQHYKENMFNHTKPYENVIELLNNLKNKNIKIAVVSNKFDLAVKELCDIYFPKLIDIAIGENEDEGIRKKPHPDTIIKVLKTYNIKKENAIYIGDSDTDIQTAINADIECISVTYGFRSREFLLSHGAKILVDTPSEILKFAN